MYCYEDLDEYDEPKKNIIHIIQPNQGVKFYGMPHKKSYIVVSDGTTNTESTTIRRTHWSPFCVKKELEKIG